MLVPLRVSADILYNPEDGIVSVGLVVSKSKASSIYINLTEATINGETLINILDTDDELIEALTKLVEQYHEEKRIVW